MVLQEFAPSYMLSDFIRTYRIVHFRFENFPALPCKAYPPRPEHCLSFYPKDLEYVEYTESNKKAGGTRAVLFGQQTEVSNRFVGNNFLLFQVVFKAGALYRMTGIPSQELTNLYIDAETIFSKEIKSINERLSACGHYNQMVAVVEAFLINEIRLKSKASSGIDLIMSSIFSKSTLPTVMNLAKDSCLSLRQYERLFKERMGVSPKYFLKVLRFENAFRMKNKYPNLDWLTVAYNCGYYDYQHLVKDYKDLTLKTPNEFHQIDLTAPERKFGMADTY